MQWSELMNKKVVKLVIDSWTTFIKIIVDIIFYLDIGYIGSDFNLRNIPEMWFSTFS